MDKYICSNINIDKELEKSGTEKKDEYLNSIQSSFKIKSITNSQLNNSNISKKNHNINYAQNSTSFNYIIPNQNNFEIIMPCQEDKIILEPLERTKKEANQISKINQFEIISDKIKDKRNIKKFLDDIDINYFENKDDLKSIEKKFESLLNIIREKLGNPCENVEVEQILEKYSIMLLDKIENSLNKKK